jgi:hypothetical protein
VFNTSVRAPSNKFVNTIGRLNNLFERPGTLKTSTQSNNWKCLWYLGSSGVRVELEESTVGKKDITLSFELVSKYVFTISPPGSDFYSNVIRIVLDCARGRPMKIRSCNYLLRFGFRRVQNIMNILHTKATI